MGNKYFPRLADLKENIIIITSQRLQGEVQSQRTASGRQDQLRGSHSVPVPRHPCVEMIIKGIIYKNKPMAFLLQLKKINTFCAFKMLRI